VSIRGVTLREELAVVFVNGVPNVTGAASSLFNEIAKHNIVVDDIIQNTHENGQRANIGFVINAEDTAIAREVAERLSKEHGYRGVDINDRVSKISAVGVGMRSHSGVAARMFEAISQAGIRIHTISTSEIVISCVVSAPDGPAALSALHEAFGLAGGAPHPAD
jgi:aspartate kinase